MKLLTLTEVANQLGVSISTARKIAPELPGAVRINARVRYSEGALQEFIRRGGCRPVGSQSQPAAV